MASFPACVVGRCGLASFRPVVVRMYGLCICILCLGLWCLCGVCVSCGREKAILCDSVARIALEAKSDGVSYCGLFFAGRRFGYCCALVLSWP